MADSGKKTYVNEVITPQPQNRRYEKAIQTAFPCTANLIAARSAGLLFAGNGLGGGVRDAAMSNSPSCIEGNGRTFGTGGRGIFCDSLPFEGAIFQRQWFYRMFTFGGFKKTRIEV
jgi:hypothetical protein